MDIVGGVQLADGWKASIVSGIDDHSRFVISAYVVRRATARPVCDALAKAMRAHGVPAEILTDNGKVFTGRFGPGKGEVLFDRICRENGIKHLLTAPRSPTTTGKVERWHKTLRREFLDGKVFADLDDAQAQLDAWVEHYNHDRPHQGIGMVVPWERFRLADPDAFIEDGEPVAVVPSTTRKVGSTGKISFAGTAYGVGVWLAGETVEVSVDDGVVSISHRGVLVQTHAQRHRPDKELAALQRKPKPRVARPRQPTVGQSVTRKVDVSGCDQLRRATAYRVGKPHARRQVQVAIVGEVVEISAGGQVLKTHPIRHDRSRAQNAFRTSFRNASTAGDPARHSAALFACGVVEEAGVARCGFCLGSGEHLLVAGEGEGDGCVAESLLDDPWQLPSGEHDRRGSMAEIVQT